MRKCNEGSSLTKSNRKSTGGAGWKGVNRPIDQTGSKPVILRTGAGHRGRPSDEFF